MALLFPKFLEDSTEYRAAEVFWHDEWIKLLHTIGQPHEWQSPWLNNTFLNGASCQDGNPIFSAVCPTRRLGIQVIQNEPGEHAREVQFFVDTFAEGDPEEIHELVISCVLTSESLHDCLDMMSQWISTEQVHLQPSLAPLIPAGMQKPLANNKTDVCHESMPPI